MKNGSSNTNYLASARQSEYDALQRQVAVLSHHWLDHSAQIKPSKIVPRLCDYIDQTKFTYLNCENEDLFSTKSEFYLGRIIHYCIEIQVNEGEFLNEKRKEIENVLAHFFSLLHQTPSSDVKLEQINPGHEPEMLDESKDQGVTWWVKLLRTLYSIRK